MGMEDWSGNFERNAEGKQLAAQARFTLANESIELRKSGKLVSGESSASSMSGSEMSEARRKQFDKIAYAPDNGPKQDTNLSGKDLAKLMEPRNLNSPFKAVNDVSAVADCGDKQPWGRRKAGLYDGNETPFLNEIDRRVKNGDIDKNTLVVALTGHGPAIAYEMAKHFRSDIYSYYPAGDYKFVGNDNERVPGSSLNDFAQVKQDQAQSFAKATHDLVASGPRDGASTLLNFDIHADEDKKIPDSVIKSLPSADDLLKMGIKKIFIAEEKPPFEKGPQKYSGPLDYGDSISPTSPIYQWLNKIKQDGRIQIVIDGIDIRNRAKEKLVQGGHA